MALDRLRQDEVDVAVVFFYDDNPPDDGIRYCHLADDPMYLLSRRPRDTLAHHRDSAWIAGCEHCRREFVNLCQNAGFTPNIAYTSDDIIVEQHLVAAGLGVTTMPGLALRAFRADSIHSTKIPGHRRRVYLATYGDPPDPPATAAFITELTTTAT